MSLQMIQSASYEWQPLAVDHELPRHVAPESWQKSISLGALWFASSAIFSTWANTAFLREFSDPLAHAFVRFGTSAVVGLGTMAVRGDWYQLISTPSLMLALWLPACCLLAANILNSLALQLSGVTICYVVKSGIPVLTVLLCLLKGESFSTPTYLALLCVCCGVALASLSDSEYCASGLASALGSAIAQTALNLTSKSALGRLGISGQQGQTMLTCSCTLAALPGVVVAKRLQVLSLDVSSPRAAGLVVAAGLAYHTEYALNFTVVRLVSPLAFSVADVARRLAIILSGAIIFHKVLTPLNGLGVGLSAIGVICFLVASAEAPPRKRRKRLPGRSL